MVGKRFVPAFQLQNYQQQAFKLGDLMGSEGLLLGFPGSIWDLASIRRLLWFQREDYKLLLADINAAFIVPNESTDLNNFHLSMPYPVRFPLLADPDETVHRAYNIYHPTLILIDAHYRLRKQWLITADGLPRTSEIVQAGQ